jgi:nucleotide-binding universal stress UspA family protein
MIVCGTDFSRSSARAVRAAAWLGRRLGEPVLLLHVVDWTQTELLGTTALDVNPARDRLRAIADRVRRRAVEVTEEIASGAPDEALVACAARPGARLVVVASLGRRAAARWLLGSVAERTAQTSPVPVLVVRRSAGFRRWAEQDWPLRVVVGVDLTDTGDAALEAAAALRRHGPCDVVVAHVLATGARGGLGSAGQGLADDHLAGEGRVRRELAERAAPLGDDRVRTRLVSGGPVAEALVALGVEAGADLLVVGTRQRTGASRWWHGSVANAVLHLAPMNVLSAPAVIATPTPPIPRLQSVLVPTDFSMLGDAAVPYAYSVVATGGTVHLLHVAEPLAKPATAEQHARREWTLVQRLRALVPEEAEARGIETRVEIVEGARTADAICGAAERLAVDLLCLASHGRSGLVGTLAGSVARQVMLRSRRPLLVTRGTTAEQAR